MSPGPTSLTPRWNVTIPFPQAPCPVLVTGLASSRYPGNPLWLRLMGHGLVGIRGMTRFLDSQEQRREKDVTEDRGYLYKQTSSPHLSLAVSRHISVPPLSLSLIILATVTPSYLPPSPALFNLSAFSPIHSW